MAKRVIEVLTKFSANYDELAGAFSNIHGSFADAAKDINNLNKMMSTLASNQVKIESPFSMEDLRTLSKYLDELEKIRLEYERIKQAEKNYTKATLKDKFDNTPSVKEGNDIAKQQLLKRDEAFKNIYELTKSKNLQAIGNVQSIASAEMKALEKRTRAAEVEAGRLRKEEARSRAKEQAKAAADKREADRKAAADKKEADRKAAADKKEADRKAADDKKAEDKKVDSKKKKAENEAERFERKNKTEEFKANLNKEYERFWKETVAFKRGSLWSPDVQQPHFMSDAQYKHMVKNASESNEKKFKAEFAKQEKAFYKAALKQMWSDPEATSIDISKLPGGKVPELIGLGVEFDGTKTAKRILMEARKDFEQQYYEKQKKGKERENVKTLAKIDKGILAKLKDGTGDFSSINFGDLTKDEIDKRIAAVRKEFDENEYNKAAAKASNKIVDQAVKEAEKQIKAGTSTSDVKYIDTLTPEQRKQAEMAIGLLGPIFAQQNQDKNRDPLADINKGYAVYNKESAKAISNNEKFASSMHEIGKKIGGTTPHIQRFKEKMREVSFAVAGAAYGFKFFNDGIMDIVSKFEQYEVKLNAVIGSQAEAKSQLEWMKDYAAQTPFDVKDLVNAGVTLKIYGQDIQKTIPLVGALASAMNQDISKAALAFGRAMKGSTFGFRVLRESFGISTEELGKYGAIVEKGRLLLHGTETGVKRASDALKAIIKEKYGNMIAYQADTLAVSLSNLQDAWSNLIHDASNSLLPVFKSIVVSLRAMIDASRQLAKTELFKLYGTGVKGSDLMAYGYSVAGGGMLTAAALTGIGFAGSNIKEVTGMITDLTRAGSMKELEKFQNSINLPKYIQDIADDADIDPDTKKTLIAQGRKEAAEAFASKLRGNEYNFGVLGDKYNSKGIAAQGAVGKMLANSQNSYSSLISLSDKLNGSISAGAIYLAGWIGILAALIAAAGLLNATFEQWNKTAVEKQRFLWEENKYYVDAKATLNKIKEVDVERIKLAKDMIDLQIALNGVTLKGLQSSRKYLEDLKHIASFWKQRDREDTIRVLASDSDSQSKEDKFVNKRMREITKKVFGREYTTQELNSMDEKNYQGFMLKLNDSKEFKDFKENTSKMIHNKALYDQGSKVDNMWTVAKDWAQGTDQHSQQRKEFYANLDGKYYWKDGKKVYFQGTPEQKKLQLDSALYESHKIFNKESGGYTSYSDFKDYKVSNYEDKYGNEVEGIESLINAFTRGYSKESPFSLIGGNRASTYLDTAIKKLKNVSEVSSNKKTGLNNIISKKLMSGEYIDQRVYEEVSSIASEGDLLKFIKPGTRYDPVAKKYVKNYTYKKYLKDNPKLLEAAKSYDPSSDPKGTKKSALETMIMNHIQQKYENWMDQKRAAESVTEVETPTISNKTITDAKVKGEEWENKAQSRENELRTQFREAEERRLAKTLAGKDKYDEEVLRLIGEKKEGFSIGEFISTPKYPTYKKPMVADEELSDLKKSEMKFEFKKQDVEKAKSDLKEVQDHIKRISEEYMEEKKKKEQSNNALDIMKYEENMSVKKKYLYDFKKKEEQYMEQLDKKQRELLSATYEKKVEMAKRLIKEQDEKRETATSGLYGFRKDLAEYKYLHIELKALTDAENNSLYHKKTIQEKINDLKQKEADTVRKLLDDTKSLYTDVYKKYYDQNRSSAEGALFDFYVNRDKMKEDMANQKLMINEMPDGEAKDAAKRALSDSESMFREWESKEVERLEIEAANDLKGAAEAVKKGGDALYEAAAGSWLFKGNKRLMTLEQMAQGLSDTFGVTDFAQARMDKLAKEKTDPDRAKREASAYGKLMKKFDMTDEQKIQAKTVTIKADSVSVDGKSGSIDTSAPSSVGAAGASISGTGVISATSATHAADALMEYCLT